MKKIIIFLTSSVAQRAMRAVLFFLFSAVLIVALVGGVQPEESDVAQVVIQKSGKYTLRELEQEIGKQAKMEIYFDQQIRDEALYISAGKYEVNHLLSAVEQACRLEVRQVGGLTFLALSRMTFAPGDELTETVEDIARRIARHYAPRVPFQEERFKSPWVDFQTLSEAERDAVVKKFTRVLVLEMINKEASDKDPGAVIKVSDDAEIRIPAAIEQELQRQAVASVEKGILKFRQEFVLSLDTYVRSDKGYMPQNRFNVRLCGQGPLWK